MPCPPPAAPLSMHRNAEATTRGLMVVSASTKNNRSPCAARPPELRVAEICRWLTGNTVALCCRAISAVASVEASSTTMISYGWPTTRAESLIACNVRPITLVHCARNDERDHGQFRITQFGWTRNSGNALNRSRRDFLEGVVSPAAIKGLINLAKGAINCWFRHKQAARRTNC